MPGDYLVIVKQADVGSGKTVYTGKPKSGSDFVDTNGDGLGDLASKDFQVIKVFKLDGTVQFSGGSKTVVTGSYLEIVYPDHAIWEDVAAGYVYPFIFTSDSDWTVDVCAQVAQGYAIVGVYDELGSLLSGESCSQAFVSGETKVVAIEVVEVGSPRPMLGALLTVSHEGKVTEVGIEVPGVRTYVEADMQPSQPEISISGVRTDSDAAVEPTAPAAPLATDRPDTGGRGGLMPVWLAVAAAFVPVTLLTGFAVWRRRT